MWCLSSFFLCCWDGQSYKSFCLYSSLLGSDSESEWSSLERRQREVYNKANRKPTLHKKTRKKRGIPVAPPRIPSFEGPPPPLPPFPGGQRIVTAQSLDPLDKGTQDFTYCMVTLTLHAVEASSITHDMHCRCPFLFLACSTYFLHNCLCFLFP